MWELASNGLRRRSLDDLSAGVEMSTLLEKCREARTPAKGALLYMSGTTFCTFGRGDVTRLGSIGRALYSMVAILSPRVGNVN